MVKNSKCVLVATRKDDESILPADLAAGMEADLSMYQSYGDGGRWQSAGFTICENSIESYLHLDEPSEALFASQRNALIQFAAMLSKVDSTKLNEFCSSGIKVEVVIALVIDDDQMELDLPSVVMAQLGRLGIPLLVSSDSF